MTEIKSETVINEESLLGIMRKYNSTSLYHPSEQFRDGKIRKVQHHKRPPEITSPYTPRIISIGPLHHGKSELQPMEDLKKKYLNDLLKGQEGLDYDGLLRKLLMAAREMEESARSFYELSSPNISSEDFVNMLVIDGCFLIEHFSILVSSTYEISLLNEIGWQLPLIKVDILLFENQIPFFVLEKLHNVFIDNDVDVFSPVRMLAYYYLLETKKMIRDQSMELWTVFDNTRIKTSNIIEASHLLHLHQTMMFETEFQPPSSPTRFAMCLIVRILLHLVRIVTFPLAFVLRFCFADTTFRTNFPSAMELEEAGVKFHGTFGKLKFEQGTLFIPVLTLNHQSFCILKNHLALEFYDRKVRPHVHTYASFLSDLIRHRGDLKVIEKYNIIMAGSEEEQPAQLLTDLLEGRYLDLSWKDPRKLRSELLEYCNTNRHRWRAKLMKDYFGNPWSILGLLVGVVLLVLTTLQTVFTVLSYYHQQRGG